MNILDLGKRLLDPSWIDQWLGFTTSWADPVADLGSGTVTALMPDVLMTLLSEGILSRFGGQEIDATLLGHDLTATLDVFKVRRRGAHFQSKTVLSDLVWDSHPFPQVTVIAHGVRLIPGVPTKVRCQQLDIEGTIGIAALVDWVNEHDLAWKAELDKRGRVVATHREKKMRAVIDAQVYDNLLTIDIRKANWHGLRVPRRVVRSPALMLDDLPSRASITYAHRRGDHVHFRIELGETTGSFDLSQMRNAIIAGTTLIVF
ncbi:hypothetical protein GCM10011591_27890 [Nocardia camponoti]|uniref:Uncharacterized protein n=2 Tax=Nocardia camponoti TaxID=1616106 RepID=A0A917VA97_9NOCA|nr:hypothetical protein GCM10011591_27890 [Nocardia camponoti]